MGFKRKMTVLALLGALSLGGVGAATAFIINDATTESSTVTFDQALVVNFGEGETGAVTLTSSTPVYRNAPVTIQKSEKVTSSIYVYFDFTFDGETSPIEIRVATSDFQGGSAVQDAVTLNSTQKTTYFTIDTSTYKEPVTYYMEFKLVEVDALDAVSVNGKLTISLESSIRAEDAESTEVGAW